jgi:rhamnose transport system substrate-binding protein
MKKMQLMLCLVVMFALLLGTIFATSEKKESSGPKRIALVVKNLGNSFFEACRDGGLEAAEELGDIEVIYQGPSTPTAEGQIEIINSLIAQQVDAIAISANDVDALVPVCKKALSKGIKVISFDSGIAAEGRILHLAPSGDEFIGRSQIKTLAEMIGKKRRDCRTERFFPGYKPECMD